MALKNLACLVTALENCFLFQKTITMFVFLFFLVMKVLNTDNVKNNVFCIFKNINQIFLSFFLV